MFAVHLFTIDIPLLEKYALSLTVFVFHPMFFFLFLFLKAFIHCSKGASCILCAASITWGAGINNLFLAGCTRRCIPSQRMDDACPVKDKKYVPKFYTFILVGMFMNRGGN